MVRHSTYKFKNGDIAKNRVVVPPMASGTADLHGFATEETFEHYSKLSKSGAGIVFVEYSYIHQSGKGEENQLGAHSEEAITGLKKIAEIIHQSSALAALQIVHTGGKTTCEITQTSLMGPSNVAVPVKGWQPDAPKEMSKDEIQNWISWFVSAGDRAVAAGFNIVELHAAHGYGLNQWLSPLTNKRNDEYGKNIRGRSRLLFEIILSVKKKHPGLLLAVRLPAQDHLEGGLQINEMAWVVSELEKLGVDLIDVSSGIGGWRRPEGRSGEGYLVSDATSLKAHTKLPVIGVGGIESGLFIDETIEAKKIDFAAVGRAILKNPQEWGELNL